MKHCRCLFLLTAICFTDANGFMDGCTGSNNVDIVGSKCINFESDLHSEIKLFIGYQEICHFSVLANKCKIYDEDGRSKSAHYKSVSEKKNENYNCDKPYMTSIAKENQKPQQEAASGNETSGGGVSASLRCLKCGELGHCASGCKNPSLTCFKCGKQGHRAAKCKCIILICYNYGEPSHIST